MKKSTKIIIIVVILVLIIAMRYNSMRNRLDIVPAAPQDYSVPPAQPATTTKPSTTTTTVVGQPTFTWSFRKTPGGNIAMTEITLTATYPNGTKVAKAIETIEGGCNEYSSPDKDVYAKSIMIMCYHSGVGRDYKVVKDDKGYAVMRKEFEEASPGYNPPVQPYKEVKRF